MKQQTRGVSPQKEGGDSVKKEYPTSDLAVFDARALFDGAREIGIHHDGSLYRLKITRQGKLILNK